MTRSFFALAAAATLLTPPLAAQITGRTGSPTRVIQSETNQTLRLVQPGPAPTGLSVTGTPAKAFVSWQPAPNAVSYSVDRWFKDNPGCCRNQATNLSTTTWTDENGMMQWPGIYVFALSATYADGSVGSAMLEWTLPEPVNPRP